MKKLLFTLLIGITTLAYSQAPQQISYQGVARNASGTVLANQPIGIRFDIHQGSASGSIVFSETHTGVLTNGFGLFTTYIGSISNLSVINWATNSYFIEVSIDPNTGTFSSLGSQQLMSVPYALNAGSAPAPAVSYTNNILSVGGNTTTIPASTTYTAGTGINVTTGNTITNTAPDQIVTITPAGSASVTGTYPNFTVNTPTIQVYTAGNGIDISTLGVISNTATAVTPTITGVGSATVISSGNTFTVNTPSLTSPTITSTGIAVVTPTTGNTFNVDVPVPVLSYTAGTNVLSLSQGTTVTTATINGTGSNTVSIVGSGLATVTPTTGSTFSVSVPSPTFTTNGPTSISGAYPNYTVNSVTSPTTSLVAGNLNLTLFPSGNTYTLDVKSYSLTANSNTLTLSNGASITTATVPASSTTTLTQGANVNVTGSPSNYTVSAPAYSITLPGGNVVQITNGVSTSTAPIAATNLTLNGANNNILSAGGNTVALNTYSAGTGISVTGTAPNFTISNTSPAVTPTITGTGVATVNNVSPNYTVNVPMSIYNNNTGVFTTGTQTIAVTPTLSLSGTTLTSGPATNSVNLSGFNGIYGGSGSIQTGSTTVTVGTNTLTFLSGNTANKPIANFFGGGITGASMTLGHVGANAANFKFVGSATTTPVDYGYVSGSTNGISISGGNSSNGLFVTNNAEVGVGTYTTGTGKYVITHAASQANPTMHLRETSGALSRIKFSNTGVANKYFEVGASNNAANNFSAYRVSFFDGTNYKSRFLIYGDGKTSINNMHAPLTTFHVMDDDATSPGIATEGFGFSGQLNLTRNNPLGVSPTYTRGAVSGIQEIGKINFAAHDGSTYGDGAKIYAKTTENVTTGTRGTELIFAAVPTGTNSNKDAFKINGTGNLEVISGLRIPLGAVAGHVLTSDAAGNASWQPGAGLSPWIQGASIVTLSNITDKVGIGTNTPSETLDVNGNINIPVSTSSVGVIKMAGANFISAPGTDNLFVGKFSGNIATSGFNNVAFGNNTFQNLTSGANNVALGYQVMPVLGSGSQNIAIGTNALSSLNIGNNNTALGFQAGNVITNGTNNLFLGYRANANLATLTNASAIGALARVDASNSMVLGSVNGINGATASTKVGIGNTSPSAILDIVNTSTVSEGLLVTNNTTNNGIRVIQSGSGSAGSFAITNSTNTAAALYISTNGTGNAIYAANSSSTAPTADFANSSADVVRAISSGGLGRALVASSNSNGTSAVDITNTGTGSALGAYKNAGSTGGNVANFANNSVLNGDDVLRAHNTGTAAAVHASNNAVDPTSALSLWVENGHVKATGAQAGVTCTLASFTTTAAFSFTGSYNDVRGKVNINCPSLSIPIGGSIDVNVQFVKPYPAGFAPIVVATSSVLNLNAIIQSQSNSNFTVRLTNNSSNIFSGITNFSFNYIVIE